MKNAIISIIVVVLGIVGLFTYKYLDETKYHFSDTKAQKIIRAELPDKSKNAKITVNSVTAYELNPVDFHIAMCFTLQNSTGHTQTKHLLLFPMVSNDEWILEDSQTMEHALFCQGGENSTTDHAIANWGFYVKFGSYIEDRVSSMNIELPEPRK